jgi:predicted DNA-binding transcriptional regulator AlpA
MSDRSTAASANHEMMDLAATCAFFGGTKPIHPATLYRGMRAGIYPLPAKMGPNTSRWIRSECQVARDAMISRPRALRPLTDAQRAALSYRGTSK